jgi:hypothetical protein
LLDVALELSEPPLDTCYLTLRDEPSATALALRKAWLAGERNSP